MSTTVRQQLTPDDLAAAVISVSRMMVIRMEEKGLGALSSRHEILGILTEEMKEFVDEVHGKGPPQRMVDELIDIAVGCLFGIASIEAGATDW